MKFLRMGNNSNSKNVEDLNLTHNEIELIKTSWQNIMNCGLCELGSGLMTRIMLEHKEVKPLWRKRTNLNDENGETINPNQVIRAHGEKVFDTIKIAIDSINDLNRVAQNLNQMGYEHYKYGVRAEHFQFFGEALLSTISDALKEKFNDKTKNVWTKIFSIIEFQMKLGMNRAESES